MAAGSGENMEKARALARDALGAWRGSDPDKAIEACDHALALLLPVGASDGLADVLRWKGSILRDRGNHAAASDLYAQSLAVADAAGYRPGRAHALNCLGTIAQLRGDIIAAERWYGDAARLAHRIMDRRLSGMVQQNLGVLAEEQGRSDEAIAHFRLALTAFEQEGQTDAALWVLNNLGLLYTREGNTARASEALDRALAMARDLGDVASEGIVEENRAGLFLALRNHSAAERSARRAWDIAEKRRDNTRRAASLRITARVRKERGADIADVAAHLHQALVLAELGEDVQLRAEILADLGDTHRATGEIARARDFWRRALEIARIAGYAAMVARVQANIRSLTTDRASGASEATLS